MKSASYRLLLAALLAFSATVLPAAAAVQEIDHIVAVVNDDVITYTELMHQTRLIKQQLKQRSAKLPPDNILQKQILEQMIMERLQLQIASRLGIRVDDETINKVINNIARDNNLTLPQFREVLSKDGYSFAEFREKIKQDIIINRLHKNRIEKNITVTEKEIDNYISNLSHRQGSHDEFHLAHILIALPEAASPEQIRAAQKKAEQVWQQLQKGADFAQTAIAVSQGRNALKGGDLGWRKAGQLPIIFSNIVFNMQPGDISKPIRSSSGFHIIKLLERRSDNSRHIVQQTLARHILIRPNEVLSSEEARQRLTKLRQRLLAGEDFAELARQYSDDTASATRGGSLGWVNPGTMVPRFEEEMNKLKPGEISEPFQTRFGWHIVQVMARRQHDETQKSKRQQARQLIGKRKRDEALQNWLRQIRSEAYVEYRLNQ